MSDAFAGQIEQAMASLREQLAKMEALRGEMEKQSASATSEDRMVTAKVGPQGQVLGLSFHTTAYRDMAPTQLGVVLAVVLNEARAAMGEKIIESMQAFQDVGDVL